MTSTMTAYVAREHTLDLRRAARARVTASPSVVAELAPIELRLAHGAEAHVITRLAELDDAAELEGPVLLALIDGRAQAGLSLRDGRVVANPFVSTKEAVDLLRLRAARLTSAETDRHGLARVRARFDARLHGRLLGAGAR